MGGPPGGPPPAGPGAGFSAEGGYDFQGGFQGDAQADAPPEEDVDENEVERAWRRRSLRVQNSLSASSGLLRLAESGSGAAGTFLYSDAK